MVMHNVACGGVEIMTAKNRTAGGMDNDNCQQLPELSKKLDGSLSWAICQVARVFKEKPLFGIPG